MKVSIAERDKKTIWHPYTPQKYAPVTIPIVKGEGVYLIDEEGKRYIDAISSWWVTIHGHGHPYIAEKIYQQARALEQVIFTNFTHLPAVTLAERLLNILPGPFAKVFYSDNGSTATEVALKMAIQYWWNKKDAKRARIIALRNSYHGDTFGAMSVSERGVFTLAFQDKLFDVLFADTPTAENPDIHFPNLDERQTDALLDETACVIYEPLIQGSGGMKMYEAGALDRFLERCKRRQVICIADEVMTGFGRTGKLFASSYCKTKPDIICLSKGLTGGAMAMGVTACAEAIHAAFVDDDKLKSLFHGHSFTANPIACAAALASLDLTEQPEFAAGISNIVDKHRSFCKQLQPYQDKKIIKNLRQTGTIMAFEVNQAQDAYISDIRDLFTNRSIEKGVYIRPLGNTVYLMPPYCISDDELDKAYGVITDILNEI
ncbi:MAG TPA: adenosylmethionine--8-amino-7-oxononanoate transaminase [Flavitalea sp.]|nr:adenosylmethionine--8-amino-7-oxononanoate transaminase [Flavitalea sp.]